MDAEENMGYHKLQICNFIVGCHFIPEKMAILDLVISALPVENWPKMVIFLHQKLHKYSKVT